MEYVNIRNATFYLLKICNYYNHLQITYSLASPAKETILDKEVIFSEHKHIINDPKTI